LKGKFSYNMAKTRNIKGLDNYLRRLNRSITRIKGNSLKGLLAAGLHVRRKSQPEVPVVTSNLKNSAFVIASNGKVIDLPVFRGDGALGMTADHGRVVTKIKGKVQRGKRKYHNVAVGYSAFYAPFVHENPRAGKTGGVSPSGKRYKPEKGSKRQVFAVGGNWKFLEGPLRRERRVILKIIRDRTMITRRDTI